MQSHHPHLQWKFKLWAGKFAWGVKTKHCWALSTNFWKQKRIVDVTKQCFALLLQVNFPANYLNFHWSWWDWLQAIFLNLFNFASDRQWQNLWGYSTTKNTPKMSQLIQPICQNWPKWLVYYWKTLIGCQ